MKILTKFRTTFASFCLVPLCAVAIPAPAAIITANPTPTPTPAGTPNFPLKISPNNRYLTDQNNVPFLMVGDSPWYLPSQLNNAEIDDYLANRAAKGFNTIMVAIVDAYFSDNAPNNIDNVAPFTTPGRFDTYNPAYFDRFDYILDQAASYGIVVIAFPTFLGYDCGRVGVAQWIINDTSAHLNAYMTFLGNRYKNKGNIIWTFGGDTDPFACGLNVKEDSAARALVAADPNHLVTYHTQYPKNVSRASAVTPWLAHGSVPSWLTLNTNYAHTNTVLAQAQTEYQRTPVRPFFYIEGDYEHGGNVGATPPPRTDVRKQSYWAILSGNCGYLYGNCPMWGLSSTKTLTYCNGAFDPDWRANLDTTGAYDVARFRNFFTTFAWQKSVPDFNHTVVTEGYSSGSTTITTGRASDGSFVASYLPAVSPITVDMTKLSGPLVNARWYDPTTGSYTTVAGSPFPNTGTRVFIPTGNNSSGASDWVLLLQSSTSPTPTPTPPPIDRSGWNLITTADFNRNGNPDYVLHNVSTQRTMIWYLNNNVYVSAAYGPSLPSGWQLAEKTRDFNGDGKPDYVLYNTSTRQTAIWYLNNNVYLGGAYGPTLPAGWMLTGTGDFNGDNKPDYVLYNSDTHQTAIWYLNNNVYVGGGFGPTLPNGWALVGVEDFDRDGHADYVLLHPSSGYTAIGYLAGRALVGGAWGPTIPSGWALVATGDFNGDGKPDYVLHNGVTRQTAIWYLNNNVYVNGAYGPTLP